MIAWFALHLFPLTSRNKIGWQTHKSTTAHTDELQASAVDLAQHLVAI